MTEIWKSLEFVGFPNYKVSDQGRITGPRGIRKAIYNYLGYVVVDLYHEGKTKQFRVNRLVAIAFIPNPNNLPTVNHKDGDKDHNWADNLEWCTAKENTQHAINLGLIKNKGANNGHSKLQEADVIFIRQHPEISQGVLGKHFNVHPTTIGQVRRGKTWK